MWVGFWIQIQLYNSKTYQIRFNLETKNLNFAMQQFLVMENSL